MRRRRRIYRTFRENWQDAFKYLKNDQKKNKSIYLDTFQIDPYFNEIFNPKESSIERSLITNNKIDYSNYIQISYDKINKSNLYDCFQGILKYIYYYSENKLNINELEFYCSGSESKIIQNQNMLNIFDYENIALQIKTECIKNAFFGITFRRIKINPISYSIRSGFSSNNSSHLISFTFEGFDEDNQKWDILDERVNLNDLIPNGGFNMYFVRSTHKRYSSFKIKQIEPGHNGFWGFSISAFEVHGIVYMKNSLNPKISCHNLDYEKDFNNFTGYNPLMDMSEFLF